MLAIFQWPTGTTWSPFACRPRTTHWWVRSGWWPDGARPTTPLEKPEPISSIRSEILTNIISWLIYILLRSASVVTTGCTQAMRTPDLPIDIISAKTQFSVQFVRESRKRQILTFSFHGFYKQKRSPVTIDYYAVSEILVQTTKYVITIDLFHNCLAKFGTEFCLKYLP